MSTQPTGKAAPINSTSPPWAHTQHPRTLDELNSIWAQMHPHLHPVIQHPNHSHFTREAATPFVEGAGAANGRRGQARYRPAFSGAGGLAGGGRK